MCSSVASSARAVCSTQPRAVLSSAALQICSAELLRSRMVGCSAKYQCSPKKFGRRLTPAALQAGLAFFCVVFAVNSAVHSYLVLRYAEGNKVAVNVGFYYMANAYGPSYAPFDLYSRSCHIVPFVMS